MKIIDYVVVVAVTSGEISQLVKDKISNGWQPYGPLLKEGNYVQALVKYDETSNKVISG